jgi:hypothetical protein
MDLDLGFITESRETVSKLAESSQELAVGSWQLAKLRLKKTRYENTRKREKNRIWDHTSRRISLLADFGSRIK